MLRPHREVRPDRNQAVFSEKELAHLSGDRGPRDFLNPRNQRDRKLKMKDTPPSAAEAIRLIAREPQSH